jgi:hypothetical protein
MDLYFLIMETEEEKKQLPIEKEDSKANIVKSESNVAEPALPKEPQAIQIEKEEIVSAATKPEKSSDTAGISKSSEKPEKVGALNETKQEEKAQNANEEAKVAVKNGKVKQSKATPAATKVTNPAKLTNKKVTMLKEPKMKSTGPISDPLDRVSPPPPEAEPTKDKSEEMIDLFPHRHYPSIYPCCNRLLEMRWDTILRKKHLMKLAAVKATVDFKPPKPYKHLQTNFKKIQMQQGILMLTDRQREINRNNKILLERMSNIMFLEAHNPEIHQTRANRIVNNDHVRQTRQMKISLENKVMIFNQKLCDRLETQQTLYNHYKLLDDRAKNLQYLQNISSFPQKFYVEESKTDKKVPKVDGMSKIKCEELRARFADPPKKQVKKRVLPAIEGDHDRPKTAERIEHMTPLEDGQESKPEIKLTEVAA